MSNAVQKQHKAPTNERPYRNIRLSKETHRRLKLIAAERGVQLQEVVEELLEWALAKQRGGQGRV
jgi:predicted HicB family RNase H-like nuclease